MRIPFLMLNGSYLPQPPAYNPRPGIPVVNAQKHHRQKAIEE
jgi:hypothetical protein